MFLADARAWARVGQGLAHPLAQFKASLPYSLGPVQTSNFSCAESNVNELNPLF